MNGRLPRPEHPLVGRFQGVGGPELVGDVADRLLRDQLLGRAAAELVAGDRVQAAAYVALVIPNPAVRDLAIDLAVATFQAAIARLTDGL